MTEQEIFEKLKEALDYNYLCTDWGAKEVDNLEDYLYAIKQEREIEKSFDEVEIETHRTYKEFIHYLADKAIGDKREIIETFDTNEYNKFIDYLQVTKEIKANKIYLLFEVDGCKLKAEWQASSNYGVWQQCGICGDDYSGYLLFPTYKDNEYFVLWYKC